MIYVASRIDGNHKPAHRNAIVTITMGDAFISNWVKVCQGSWITYAARHGFDIVIISTPLDFSDLAVNRSPAWQKLLILDQPWAQAYERIVWLDADIIINQTAPDILLSVPDHGRIGIAAADRTSAVQHIINERLTKLGFAPQEWPEVAWNLEADIFEKTLGFAVGPDTKMYNTGVLVLSPQHHRELLLHTYKTYNAESRIYEQPGLSYEIGRSGLACEFSPRFNWLVMNMRLMYFPHTWFTPVTVEMYRDMLPMLRKELELSYFLHFAGCMSILLMMQNDDGGQPFQA